MRSYFESDTGFYYAVGAFTIGVFVAAVAALAAVGPSGVGTRELAGLVGGFVLFMLVYFVSITVHRLEESEDV
ncbi:hypothetical protein [Natrarchaeobius oligotrophus]|uniref:Uncharacterized protein n=1 Tax=Natrarchaeobius chitinivorans TaxID=1679083 RepID=A0A3N6MHW9_NATCH|nr:hypothetical protein [Natrarchaeobius chitinivorans]RQH00735.1 hypothetical protein EA472_08810 [Natrarchaeobius chitinivorans]